ncbi:hypothetical protein [Lentzea flava]|uniref:LPXTG-motif cell wall anchor domain-containing protein n=1 Tax=Lentzea flava TaxID=103732 RepID=A0ABQ2US27_9PSEU|nr:hypothetical protein [Lentzea flava]MCP2197268.1 hypothetical protein [Lentzea flava]GGU50330.1 hypothetical protein GCM10010178_48850 [Lentzea flava]
MTRLSGLTAGFLTVVLCLGMSAGPVLADPETSVAQGPAETSPVPVVTEPAAPEPTAPEPTATEPATPEATKPQPTSTEPTSTEPATSAPSAEAAAQELADLRLRVWFDKPSYRSDEVILVHAAVTNAGTATANQVVLSWTGNLDNHWWPPFDIYGVPIEPGQTVEGTTSGRISTDEETLHLVVTARQFGGEQDANPEDNAVTASVPVEIPRGSFRATVYGDREGDHVMDPGEALAGVPVHISGGFPHTERSATTAADGVIEFRDLPAGAYNVFPTWYRSGWWVPGWSGTVDGVDDPDLLLRATPEVTDRLTASLAFTRVEYRAGDVPRATLTLHNTGTVLLTDLSAHCGSADVGELDPGGPGAVLHPGETRVFPVTMSPITDDRARWGYLSAMCQVGAPVLHNDIPYVTALARVLGPVAPRVTGRLGVQTYKPMQGPPTGYALPGVKIYLRDRIDNAVVARDTSNANGEFTFYNVRPGLYQVGVVGPWRVVYGSEMVVEAGENGSSRHLVFVLPGPDQPDPDPAPPAGGSAPPPPVVQEPQLAATGANVAWLALSGLLSLLTGAALVLRTRPGRR